MKCPACNGTYSTITADGGDYFHGCPPLSAVEAEAVAQGCIVSKVPCDPNTGAFIPTPQGKALVGKPRTPAAASVLTASNVTAVPGVTLG